MNKLITNTMIAGILSFPTSGCSWLQKNQADESSSSSSAFVVKSKGREPDSDRTELAAGEEGDAVEPDQVAGNGRRSVRR